jgi:hypothetical protein
MKLTDPIELDVLAHVLHGPSQRSLLSVDGMGANQEKERNDGNHDQPEAFVVVVPQEDLAYQIGTGHEPDGR